MILPFPLRSPQLGRFHHFKQSRWLFPCRSPRSRSLLIARYLITAPSKQARVRPLERKHWFPAGSPWCQAPCHVASAAAWAVPGTLAAPQAIEAGVPELGFFSSPSSSDPMGLHGAVSGGSMSVLWVCKPTDPSSGGRLDLDGKLTGTLRMRF